MKDTWTKPKWGRIRGRSGDGCGGVVVGEKWRQLYLNNKIKK